MSRLVRQSELSHSSAMCCLPACVMEHEVQAGDRENGVVWLLLHWQ